MFVQGFCPETTPEQSRATAAINRCCPWDDKEAAEFALKQVQKNLRRRLA